MPLIQGFPLCKFPRVMMKIISGFHKVNILSGLWKCGRKYYSSLGSFFDDLLDAQKESFLWEIKYAPLFIMDIMDAP